jgi:hypothetical protein
LVFEALPLFLKLIGNQSEGDSQPSASWRRVQPPPFRKFREHQNVEVETETPNIRPCSVIADRKYRTLAGIDGIYQTLAAIR